MSGSKETEGALEFLEAAYAWHLPEPQWLERLADAAARVWGRPRWSCGFTYDGSDAHRFRVSRPVVPAARTPWRTWSGTECRSRAPSSWPVTSVRSPSASAGLGAVTQDSDCVLTELETADFFGLNGLDISGRGCFIGIGAERTLLTTQEILVFQRLATHLSSAYRIRRRLQELQQEPLSSWEALLLPDGKLLDARGPAKPVNARQALHQATRSMEGVRARRDDQEPTAGWRPRSAGAGPSSTRSRGRESATSWRARIRPSRPASAP